MATTFDPNRVGPGTFKLVRDASTGTYSIQEVGFTKLPSLTLPDLSPTTTTKTQTQTQDQTKTDTTDVTQPILPQVGGGGGGDRQDFTSFIPKTPDDQIDQATQISQNLNNQFLASGAAGGQRLPSTDPQQGFLASGAAGGASLQVDENKIDRGNPTGDPRIVSEEQGLVGSSAKIPDRIMKRTSEFGALPFNQDPIVKDENIITVKPSIMEKAKNIVENSLVVKVASGVGKVLKGANEALIGPRQVALNNSNKNALSSLGYKTRGELGGSTDPGRIAGNPADNVFAGMNMVSARGDVMQGARNRVSTRKSAKTQKRISKLSPEKQKAFNDKTAEFEAQIEAAQAKKNKADLATGGVAPGASGGGGGSGGGGKSIVCTAMYQTTGLQDWAKAMKIWYIYQKRYLTIQHQEGYHKLFKPFVKAMHKSNIIKAIGAHFAKHRTQHLKHVLFKSKPSLLGKVYSKVLETICYWAGKK